MCAVTLCVQSLSCSNQPRIALHVQLLPPCSNNHTLCSVCRYCYTVTNHVQNYTQTNLVQCDQADRDPFFALAPTFCSKLNRTYFSPVGLWCIAQFYLIEVSAWVTGIGYIAGDIGLQASGLTCRWIGVAEQQACFGALQYGGFRQSNCAR